MGIGILSGAMGVALLAGTAGAAPLALPSHHASAAQLGAHRFAGVSSIQVLDGPQVAYALEEVSTLEVAAGGDLRVRSKNDQQLGRELVFARGWVWVRPGGNGKFVRRRPVSPDEAERVADEATGALAAHWALVERFAEVKEGGALRHAGRPAHRMLLSLAAAARPGGQGWRAEIAVSALEGEVVLDDATGALLHGVLRARVEMTRAGHAYEMTIAASHDLTAIGDAAIAISPPPDDQVVVLP